MSPRIRLWAAWILLVACLIGWAASLFVFATGEPPWVLSLSWGALILTCLDIISTQDVRKKQEGSGGEGE
jgi:hypothetical protein